MVLWSEFSGHCRGVPAAFLKDILLSISHDRIFFRCSLAFWWLRFDVTRRSVLVAPFFLKPLTPSKHQMTNNIEAADLRREPRSDRPRPLSHQIFRQQSRRACGRRSSSDNPAKKKKTQLPNNHVDRETTTRFPQTRYFQISEGNPLRDPNRQRLQSVPPFPYLRATQNNKMKSSRLTSAKDRSAHGEIWTPSLLRAWMG